MVLLLMVMPRSRSMSIESRIWSRKSRASTPPQRWMRRSARVDFPWSMWAMMQKLRMSSKTIYLEQAPLCGSWRAVRRSYNAPDLNDIPGRPLSRETEIRTHSLLDRVPRRQTGGPGCAGARGQPAAVVAVSQDPPGEGGARRQDGDRGGPPGPGAAGGGGAALVLEEDVRRWRYAEGREDRGRLPGLRAGGPGRPRRAAGGRAGEGGVQGEAGGGRRVRSILDFGF